uniref:RNA-directed RNA polymerase C-terminal domain-containing protein n=1 Tax=Riboviria sp. TaxID=2585031 RepID=A0A8K1U2S6_9VIRU|nr:MAG: hypothetical protein 2 [Riboviria sp.]
MEQEYKGCAVSIDDFDDREWFNTCVRNLDFRSSPGYPFMNENSTIGGWLEFDGLGFSAIKMDRLWMMVNALMEDEEVECLWRVFIKMEPHKRHKILQERYRLIMCPPLHVQILWQMLFSRQNSMEIDQAYFIPSQQGMMLPFGNWRLFYSQWKDQGTTCGTDATAWDWNLPGWVLQLDLKFRERQVRGSRTKHWMEQAAKLYRNAFRDCKLLFSDGTVYQQMHWGIMKSGCVNTISTNSHGGVMYHIIYCLVTGTPMYPMPKCMGDDKLVAEEHILDLEVYERYGNLIKSVSTTCEFGGHEFTDDGPKPMYLGKHVYNFLHVEPDVLEDTLDAYLRMNALNDEGWDFWSNITNKLGLAGKVLSRSYYQAWYNNPEGAVYGW